VFLHGATSKRDSMWHSPIFTCISPKRIPVKRIKCTVDRNFKMEICLPFHWSHRPLVLMKFIAGHITNKKISSYVRKQSFMISGISWSNRKMTDPVIDMTNFKYFSPNLCNI
jgi:hypothetical protein